MRGYRIAQPKRHYQGEEALNDVVSVSTYRESLPVSCPPAEVAAPQASPLWRLLRSQSVSESDFDSQRKRLPNHPYPDECGAMSVSLTTSLAACRAIAKSPRSKFTHAVEIHFQSSAGVWHQDSPGHVHFWPYYGHDLMTLVGAVNTL